ncbi:P-loop containing nucleoside triphosphate hydrolase protein [Caulochytrium protostelioides]|uniref:P-loop containing nucleoside triphosphate hydrolase protein n=1 Tax=Caulochytrium protostelioides TaxID=1555241 RepID=A0A4V1ITF5_9FUNG|nr:P-loop containing nucleoside triphosphate hydrolase protein [Caulochytrium protostelioides]
MDLYLKHSKLDASQAKALLNGLSRSIALLQGPPGTGKSFTSVALINTLIDSGLANDAPILCVAFTNHAVDQILNRLIAQGVAPSKILRLGPNSLLTTVAKESSLTPNKPFGNDSFRHLRDIRKELTQHLQTYASQARIVAEGITLALNPLLEEAWDYAAQQKAQCQDPTKAFYRFLTGRVPRRTPEHHSGVTFTEENRQQIGRQWFDIAVQARSEKSGEILQRYSAESGRMGKDAKSVTASDIRQSFRVMGVTTSSLANRLDLIRAVRPKILICEEAAETLEAHSLISLLPSVEHVLMNGDHKQLRPVVSSYELTAASQEGRAISYDISLFERMVAPPPDLAATNVLPYDTLEIQRRMTPDVSKLIRKSVYPFLQDGESVHDYPLVPGMLNRVFWQHHYFGEESDEESFFNPFEVDMVTALVKYLTECGTKAQNIAVITPYKYQMQRLKQAIYSALQVRPYDPLAEVPTIVTVDEFQGCEADVVVVSMVRSNEKHECGFLKIQNRVNVMLSRAKHAMYIVGNADTASRGPMLGEVVEQLRSARLVGPAFMTACHRHPGEAVPAAMPGDLSEQAVCRSLCNVTMACGHPCVKSCHGDAHQCRAICKKPLPQCGHPCTQQCGVACTAICLVVVETASSDVTLTCGHPAPANATCHDFSHGLVRCTQMRDSVTQLPCGHEARLSCDQTVENYRCKEKVSFLLPCGHERSGVCSSPPSENVSCKEPVTLGRPDCGHLVSLPCCETDRPASPCMEAVDVLLKGCGHLVRAACHQAKDTSLQLRCKAKTTTVLACGHEAVISCRAVTRNKPINCKQQCPLPCGHTAKCYEAVDANNYRCLVVIGTRPCGHEQLCGMGSHCEVTVPIRKVDGVALRLPTTAPCHMAKTVGRQLALEEAAAVSAVLDSPSRAAPCKHGFDAAACEKSIDLYLPCGHRATVACRQTSDLTQVPCPIICTITYENCLHEKKLACSELEKHQTCDVLIPVLCVRGHPRELTCGEQTTADPTHKEAECEHQVARSLSCGHTVGVPCFQAETPVEPRCTAKIIHVLPCGHKTDIECAMDAQQRDAVPCHHKLEVTGPCGHSLGTTCIKSRNEDLPACTAPVERICNDCSHRSFVACARASTWSCQNKAVLSESGDPGSLRRSGQTHLWLWAREVGEVLRAVAYHEMSEDHGDQARVRSYHQARMQRHTFFEAVHEADFGR